MASRHIARDFWRAIGSSRPPRRPASWKPHLVRGSQHRESRARHRAASWRGTWGRHLGELTRLSRAHQGRSRGTGERCCAKYSNWRVRSAPIRRANATQPAAALAIQMNARLSMRSRREGRGLKTSRKAQGSVWRRRWAPSRGSSWQASLGSRGGVWRRTVPESGQNIKWHQTRTK